MDAGELIVGATAAMLLLGVGIVAVVVGGPLLFDDTPDSVSELSDEDLPDGITKDGVQDPQAAAADHGDALEGSAYTLEVGTVRNPQTETAGTVEVTQTLRNDGDGTIRTRIERSGTNPYAIDIWANESLAVRKVTRGNSTSYDRVDAAGLRQSATGEATVREMFAAGNFVPTDLTTEDGRQIVVLTAEEPSEGAANRLGVDSVSSLSGTARVDSDGRVHSLEMEFTYTTQSGTQISQTLTLELRDVGATTVDRPPWVGEALGRTGGGNVVPADGAAIA